MIEEFSLNGLKLIMPKKYSDERGFFSETYNAKMLQEVGINCNFVQDNHSLSRDIGTLRGLHFQTPPFEQDKLIRVLKGRILDVAVDLRKSSTTFGQHLSVELSGDNWKQLFIPSGFAHGFLTLEPDTEVFYKVTKFYSPAHDSGILWNDPELAISWPITVKDVILSVKDRSLPLLRYQKEFFP